MHPSPPTLQHTSCDTTAVTVRESKNFYEYSLYTSHFEENSFLLLGTYYIPHKEKMQRFFFVFFLVLGDEKNV